MAKTNKKPYTKRTKRTKKPAPSTGYQVAQTAYTALKMAKRLNDMVNAEYKDREGILNDTTSTNVGTIYPLLPDIPQGLGFTNRIGDSIKLQRLTFRYTLKIHPSSTATSYRMILFQGKHENGNPYTAGTILQYQDILSPKTNDTRFNTKFLIDKTYVLDKAKTNLITGTWNVPLNWHTNFNPGSPNIIKDGGLYLMCIQNDTVNPPNNHIIYKVSFTDD